jgi:hypothetical protein
MVAWQLVLFMVQDTDLPFHVILIARRNILLPADAEVEALEEEICYYEMVFLLEECLLTCDT